MMSQQRDARIWLFKNLGGLGIGVGAVETFIEQINDARRRGGMPVLTADQSKKLKACCGMKDWAPLSADEIKGVIKAKQTPLDIQIKLLGMDGVMIVVGQLFKMLGPEGSLLQNVTSVGHNNAAFSDETVVDIDWLETASMVAAMLVIMGFTHIGLAGIRACITQRAGGSKIDPSEYAPFMLARLCTHTRHAVKQNLQIAFTIFPSILSISKTKKLLMQYDLTRIQGLSIGFAINYAIMLLMMIVAAVLVSSADALFGVLLRCCKQSNTATTALVASNPVVNYGTVVANTAAPATTAPATTATATTTATTTATPAPATTTATPAPAPAKTTATPAPAPATTTTANAPAAPSVFVVPNNPTAPAPPTAPANP